ncbi:hypothetical protein [Humibacillus xanthopallidus]|uniref:hypothetical protein n=1 Tax=Humibacillus xanthopallidus TaxID=412689 RepID=UPI00384CF6FD
MLPARLSPFARRLTIGLAGAVLLLAALYVVTYWLRREPGRLDYSLFRMVHLNREFSLPTWFNTILLMGVALLAFCARAVATDRAERRAWLVVGIGVTYLSLDEAAALHEVLPNLLGLATTELRTFQWLGAGIVAAAVGSAVLVVVGRALQAPLRRPLLLGLVAYGAGALGVEFVTGYIELAYPSPRAVVEHGLKPALVVLEEGLEMLACVWVIGHLATHLESRVTRLAAPTPAAA